MNFIFHVEKVFEKSGQLEFEPEESDPNMKDPEPYPVHLIR